MTIPRLDRPPRGWYVRIVVPRDDTEGCQDWTALMFDVDPNSDNYRKDGRAVRECWVRIAGKHKSHAAACEALEAMMATRH
jgi:hypothetical protein